MKPRSNKKLKYFGKKTEDKYLLRGLRSEGKYLMDYYSSSVGYIKDVEHHHHNYVCMFSNFNGRKTQAVINSFDSEKRLLYFVIACKNRKSPQKRYHAHSANKQERIWCREGLQMLRQNLEDEKGYELTQKRYGSIAWDVY